MNLSPLLKLFDQIPAYKDFADALHWGEPAEAMRRPLGLFTAARPALLAALQTDLQRPILFITARADRARILTEQIQVWANNPLSVYRLPDPDSLPHEKVFWGIETIQGRLSALSALVAYRREKEMTQPPLPDPELPLTNLKLAQRQAPLPALAPLIVTSARALMHHTLPHSEFTLMEFKEGQRIRLNEVVEQWVELGYQPEDVVEVAGSFSRRGGILDVFPPSSPKPIRIELFGDEIDSLRSFDPSTQRSENRLKSFLVGPATETLPRRAPAAAERLSRWDLTDLQPSTKITFEEDIVRLANGTAFRGIEYYIPFFYNGRNGALAQPAATSILDYLPDDALIFIEDPQELAGVVDELELQARKLKQDLVNLGDLPTEWPDPYFGWSDLVPALTVRQPLILGFTTFGSQSPPVNKESGSLTHAPYYFQSTFTAAPAFGGQVKNVLPEIVRRKKEQERLVLVSRQSARLSHLLNEFDPGLTVPPLETMKPDDPPPPSGSITLMHGMLIEGWSVRGAGSGETALVTVMSDSELFGWKKPTTVRRPKPRKGITPETFFADVDPGDLVVHIEHGIGRYVGLVKLDFEGIEREYLAVEYANKDKLYVPIHQADRLSRYIGADDHLPLLNRLGSADWNTVKRRAKKAVEDIAKELLEIYAKRGMPTTPTTNGR